MKSSYPSVHILKWLQSIRAAFAPDPDKGSVCECTAVITAEQLPPKHRPHFVNGIFWSTWIDQALYYALVQGGAGLPSDRALYGLFREIWPFPKIRAHIPSGMVTPSALFGYGARDLTPLPTRDMLLRGRQAFWTDEVARWLAQNMNRPEVVEAVEVEFRRDQRVRFCSRFQDAYGMLFG